MFKQYSRRNMSSQKSFPSFIPHVAFQQIIKKKNTLPKTEWDELLHGITNKTDKQ
jgi:hypothetical protein